MDPIERMERKRETQRRIRAQQRRVGQLRSRVIAISLIAFVFLWGVVFVQMATGNDPVLGDPSSAIAPRSRPHAARANVPESGASTDSEEPSSVSEPLETSEPEVIAPVEEVVEPVEEEFIEPEPEPEFIEPEPEPAPVTTGQS